MKNRKKMLLFYSFFILSLFLQQTSVFAQEKNQKYEIAVDLQNLFSNGYPDKVLFKINNIKQNQIVGAYRFGLGALYWHDIYKITHDNENYDLTAKKQQGKFSLSLGYEFQKQLNRAVFYYGADFGTHLVIEDNSNAPHINEFYNLFFVPFAGVKVFISNNLSLAFEGGIENIYLWWKGEGSEGNPDNRQYHSAFISELQLPYSLTFNFNF